ncbi:MAG: FkbM family methyltransferase, partial [Chryseobacterium sp.]
AEHSDGVFPDFLSLDVEGVDMEILESVDFEKNAPIVICVETVSFSDSSNGVKDFKIADFLGQKGYMVYADTFINTIFVKKEKWINRN